MDQYYLLKNKNFNFIKIIFFKKKLLYFYKKLFFRVFFIDEVNILYGYSS